MKYKWILIPLRMRHLRPILRRKMKCSVNIHNIRSSQLAANASSPLPLE